MYITKLFVPAMLVLSGLAQARPAAADTDVVALSAQDTSLLSDTALLSRHDPDSSDPDPEERSAREDEAAKDLGAREPRPQSQRPWCRDDEYWDRFWRRCRRYPPLPRPVCRREERAYCGRGRRDWVPYGEFSSLSLSLSPCYAYVLDLTYSLLAWFWWRMVG